MFVLRSIVLATLPVLLSAAPTQAPERGGVIPLVQRSAIPITPASRRRALQKYTAFRSSGDPRAVQADFAREFEDPTITTSPPRPWNNTNPTFFKRAYTAGVPILAPNGMSWEGKVTTGFPAQTFTVVIDTGSADFILPGPKCNRCRARGKHIYTPKQGQDLTRAQRFSISFGLGTLGSTEGKVYRDTVNIAGLTASAQGIGVADQMGEDFLVPSFTADGLLGLGFESLSTTKTTPLIQTLAQQGQIDRPLFAFLMRPGKDCYSELSLGFANPRMYTSKGIEYTSVVQEAYWIVKAAISVGGKVVVGPGKTMIDTGSAHSYGKPDVVRRLYAAIPGATLRDDFSGEYSIPCDATLPPITVTFGKSTRLFNFNPDHFIQKDVQGDGCYGGILALRNLPTDFILGGTFLHDFYTVFDATPGTARVGFGEVSPEMHCAPRAIV